MGEILPEPPKILNFPVPTKQIDMSGAGSFDDEVEAVISAVGDLGLDPNVLIFRGVHGKESDNILAFGTDVPNRPFTWGVNYEELREYNPRPEHPLDYVTDAKKRLIILYKEPRMIDLTREYGTTYWNENVHVFEEADPTKAIAGVLELNYAPAPKKTSRKKAA